MLGGLLKRAVLESAWGVVAVKRVASETLRGVVDIGMVVLVSGWWWWWWWERYPRMRDESGLVEEA